MSIDLIPFEPEKGMEGKFTSYEVIEEKGLLVFFPLTRSAAQPAEQQKEQEKKD